MRVSSATSSGPHLKRYVIANNTKARGAYAADPEYFRQGSGMAVTSICLECFLNGFALIEHQVPVSLLSYRNCEDLSGCLSHIWSFGFFYSRRAIGMSRVPLPWRHGVTGAEQIVPIVRLVVMVAEDAGRSRCREMTAPSETGLKGERASVWPSLILSMALKQGCECCSVWALCIRHVKSVPARGHEHASTSNAGTWHRGQDLKICTPKMLSSFPTSPAGLYSGPAK